MLGTWSYTFNEATELYAECCYTFSALSRFFDKMYQNDFSPSKTTIETKLELRLNNIVLVIILIEWEKYLVKGIPFSYSDIKLDVITCVITASYEFESANVSKLHEKWRYKTVSP